MKKRIWIPVLLVLLLAAGELILEHRFSENVLAPTEQIAEEILAERPDIAISETDLALEAYVLALPQVQEMLVRAGSASGRSETLDPADAAPLLADWTEPGWSCTECSVTNGSVFVNFQENSGETAYRYSFFPGGDTSMHKTIVLYEDGGRTCTAVYENRGGELKKYVPRHLWFSWIESLTGAED